MVAKAHTLGPGSLKFGETASLREIAQQLTKMLLDPNTTEEDGIAVLSGETVAGEQSTAWALKGTVNQDYDIASFEIWCLEHTGETIPFVFTPNNDHASVWVGSARIRPIAVGGEVKKKNTSDFEFTMPNAPIATVAD